MKYGSCFVGIHILHARIHIDENLYIYRNIYLYNYQINTSASPVCSQIVIQLYIDLPGSIFNIFPTRGLS